MAWVPTLGLFAIALLDGLEHHALALDVWLHAMLLAILLAAYAMLVDRVASWEHDLARALSLSHEAISQLPTRSSASG